MTQREAEDLVRAIVRGLSDTMRVLVTRIEALEARPTLKYSGVWDVRRAYQPGELVTFSGCMWHANEANVGSKPGSGSATWQLAVKSGRDGR